MQILITDKGNFLVENEGSYGFFDKTGKFLEIADGKEWNWCAKRMRVFTGKAPDFDLDSLSKAKLVVVEDVMVQNNSVNKTFTLADLIKPSQKNKKVARAI